MSTDELIRMPSFADALRAGKIRPASAMDLEQFANAQRASIATKLPSKAQAAPPRPAVTSAIRDHIAGLRQLLRPRVLS